jgi:hypothetical protein
LQETSAWLLLACCLDLKQGVFPGVFSAPLLVAGDSCIGIALV